MCREAFVPSQTQLWLSYTQLLASPSLNSTLQNRTSSVLVMLAESRGRANTSLLPTQQEGPAERCSEVQWRGWLGSMCLARTSYDYFHSYHSSPLMRTLVRILSAANEKNLHKISLQEKKALLAQVTEAHSFRHGWIKPQMTPPCLPTP